MSMLTPTPDSSNRKRKCEHAVEGGAKPPTPTWTGGITTPQRIHLSETTAYPSPPVTPGQRTPARSSTQQVDSPFNLTPRSLLTPSRRPHPVSGTSHLPTPPSTLPRTIHLSVASAPVTPLGTPIATRPLPTSETERYISRRLRGSLLDWSGIEDLEEGDESVWTPPSPTPFRRALKAASLPSIKPAITYEIVDSSTESEPSSEEESSDTFTDCDSATSASSYSESEVLVQRTSALVKDHPSTDIIGDSQHGRLTRSKSASIERPQVLRQIKTRIRRRSLRPAGEAGPIEQCLNDLDLLSDRLDLRLGLHVSSRGPKRDLIRWLRSPNRAKALAFHLVCPKRHFEEGWSEQDTEDFTDLLAAVEARDPDIKRYIFPHAALTNNLALRPDSVKGQQGFLSLMQEANLASRLGLKYLVVHPGYSDADRDARTEALANVAANISSLQSMTPNITFVIETMAHQNGRVIGSSLTDLQAIHSLVEDKDRLKFCLDLCHVYSSLYDLSTRDGRGEMMWELDAYLGLENIVCVHVSDTHAEHGSGVDQHCRIGAGVIGLSAFRAIVRDPRLAHAGFVLETPPLHRSSPSAAATTDEVMRCREELEYVVVSTVLRDREWRKRRRFVDADQERRWRKVSARAQRHTPVKRGWGPSPASISPM